MHAVGVRRGEVLLELLVTVLAPDEHLDGAALIMSHDVWHLSSAGSWAGEVTPDEGRQPRVRAADSLAQVGYLMAPAVVPAAT